MPARLTIADAIRLGIVIPDKLPRPKRKQNPPVIHWAACGLPEPQAEYLFHETRKWRLDYFWPSVGSALYGSVSGGLALEIDGGAWTQGRHTRGRGFCEDQRKRNAATLAGIRVFHCTWADVKSGAIFQTLREAMGL